jgi:general secretion pathway protein H
MRLLRSHISCNKSIDQGFTLIELLIVLFIISIVTTSALLTIRYNANKQLETIAQEISGRLKLAEEQAMLMPAVIGIAFDGRSLQFLRYSPAENSNANVKKPTWDNYDDSTLTGFTVPEGVSLDLRRQSSEAQVQQDNKKENEDKVDPAIIISTNGDITPFTMTIAETGKKPMWIIYANENGAIYYKALN